MVDLGGRLKVLAQTVDPDYRRPEGRIWSKPLDEQNTRVLFLSGPAEALAREVDADYARTANEAYTSQVYEDQARREQAAPAPAPLPAPLP